MGSLSTLLDHTGPLSEGEDRRKGRGGGSPGILAMSGISIQEGELRNLEVDRISIQENKQLMYIAVLFLTYSNLGGETHSYNISRP